MNSLTDFFTKPVSPTNNEDLTGSAFDDESPASLVDDAVPNSETLPSPLLFSESLSDPFFPSFFDSNSR